MAGNQRSRHAVLPGRTGRDPSSCVLRVEGLEKSFRRGLPPRRRRVDVLKGADLMVCPGELVGLVGENGFVLFGRAYGMDDKERERAVADLLGELQFERYRGYRVEDLSGGTRQKLNLALALMHDPTLLLLDEPYSGFDWETYLRFWEAYVYLSDLIRQIVELKPDQPARPRCCRT